jgi:ABC-type Fe3+-hydroxamate transport system substrate-binding protein
MNRQVTRREMARGIVAAGVAVGLSPHVGLARQSTPETSPASDQEVRTISAANGEIEIAGTPQRVVFMEYELVEDAVTLGIVPIGVCERDSINRWVPLPEPLDDSIVDVGTRDEPDMEAILGLEPDLIIAAKPRQDETLEQLEAIAPTVQLETYSPFFTPASDMTPIQHAQLVLQQVADATNRTSEAEAAISAFDALLEKGTAAVEASEYAGRTFVYLGQIVDTSSVTMFNDHSRIGFTISQLGLTNLAGENEETPGLHYQDASVEMLGRLIPEDALVFVSPSVETAEELDAFFNGSVWQAMPFVQAGNFVNLGEPNVWTAGSMITLSGLIERVTAALGLELDA